MGRLERANGISRNVWHDHFGQQSTVFLKFNTVQPRDPASPALAFAQEERGDAHGRRVWRRSLQLQPGRPPQETAPMLPSEQRSSVPPHAPDKVLDQEAGAEGTRGRSPWKILESATYAGLEPWGRAGEALGVWGLCLDYGDGSVEANRTPTGTFHVRFTTRAHIRAVHRKRRDHAELSRSCVCASPGRRADGCCRLREEWPTCPGPCGTESGHNPLGGLGSGPAESTLCLRGKAVSKTLQQNV